MDSPAPDDSGGDDPDDTGAEGAEGADGGAGAGLAAPALEECTKLLDDALGDPPTPMLGADDVGERPPRPDDDDAPMDGAPSDDDPSDGDVYYVVARLPDPPRLEPRQ